VVTSIEDVKKMIVTAQTQVAAPQKQVTPQYRCCRVTSEVPDFSVIWTPGKFRIQGLRLMPGIQSQIDLKEFRKSHEWNKLNIS
jgi:hypothetical protein